jgi:hypothetical protein
MRLPPDRKARITTNIENGVFRKGGVRQDYGDEGGRSSAIRRTPAHDRRKTSWRQAQFPSLNDQVPALATGNTQQEIAAACKGARPNHVGAAIARHKRAGRIEERDRKLYATQSTERSNARRSDATIKGTPAGPSRPAGVGRCAAKSSRCQTEITPDLLPWCLL